MIILASSSPRRKEILDKLGISYTAIPSDYEEEMHLKLSPPRLVMRLAHNKAKDVARKNKGIIVGVDTVVVTDRIIGKPKSSKEAEQMLQEISGKNIRIYSGIALINQDITLTDSEMTRVKMGKIDKSTIKAYVRTGEPLDKAGAFAIQGKGAIFIEKINGCYHNVMGLPTFRLASMFQQIGINIPSFWLKD
ncbi:MAG: Maf family protein [Candidatus Woesearchaeota archaeon]